MKASARWHEQPGEPGRCVLVDIDGVLSDASTRQHYLNNPEGLRDWRGFFGSVGDDNPLQAVPTLLALLDGEVKIVLLSARPAWVVDITVQWLHRHAMPWDLLILRGDDDIANAADFKRAVLAELRGTGWQIELAIDDDERIVDMYRSEQQPALYIHSGYYTASTTPSAHPV